MCHFDCVNYGCCDKEIECKDCEDYINNLCDICTGYYCEKSYYEDEE